MDPHGRRGGSESPAGPGLESRFDGIRLFFPREHVLPDGGALSPAQGPEGARYLRQGRFLFSGSGPLHRRALYRTGRDPLRKRKVTSGPFRQTVRGGQKALSDGRLFDGLDVTKEICFFFGGVRDLVRRGIACLLVDGPGNGESIRFRDLYLRYDQEVPAGAAVDYLETRSDVDPKRIGVMALSLGGYYAPRSASFEKRFRACVAWGAQWDYHAVWIRRVEAAYKTALSVPPHHIMWV